MCESHYLYADGQSSGLVVMILKTHSFTLTGLELHERGAKTAIARELGVPAVTVYRWIQRKSVPPGYELAIKEKVAHKKTIALLYDQHNSPRS